MGETHGLNARPFLAMPAVVTELAKVLATPTRESEDIESKVIDSILNLFLGLWSFLTKRLSSTRIDSKKATSFILREIEAIYKK